MSNTLIEPPEVEPLAVDDVITKLHLRVDDVAEDQLLTTYIAATRRAAEHQTGRKLIAQTWELALDAFPAAEIELPFPPVASITSIKYLDGAGIEQTLPAEAYTLDAATLPGWVFPAAGYEWPATFASANAVRIRFVAGWADAAAVPEDIKLWMLAHIGNLYRNRESVNVGNIVNPMPYIDALLDPWRIWRA